MQVCDRCREPVKGYTEVIFDKEDASRKSNRRRMLSIKMELCEACITEFLRAFGNFKVNFMQKKAVEDEKPVRSPKITKK